LFCQALKDAGPGEWVFPSTSTTAKQPTIHPDSINNTVRRLRERNDGVFEDGSLHVTRHTMATWLSNELCIDDKLIERLLNHTPQDVTRKRYNHGRPGGLMRDALQRWADHVSDVVGLPSQ
jgi:integrase